MKNLSDTEITKLTLRSDVQPRGRQATTAKTVDRLHKTLSEAIGDAAVTVIDQAMVCETYSRAEAISQQALPDTTSLLPSQAWGRAGTMRPAGLGGGRTPTCRARAQRLRENGSWHQGRDEERLMHLAGKSCDQVWAGKAAEACDYPCGGNSGSTPSRLRSRRNGRQSRT